MYYFCHRKQGEKIGCYRFIGTTVFGVQGGSDATLFFFGGGLEVALYAGAIRYLS